VINGASCKAKGDLTGAIIEFLLAQKYDTSASINYALSECFLFANRYDLAIEYAHRTLHKDPEFLPAYESLVRAYISINDLPNATIT